MDLLSSFSPEEELGEDKKRIRKASIPEIVNKLEYCSSASVATPDFAGLLYLYDRQGNWGRSMITMLSSSTALAARLTGKVTGDVYATHPLPKGPTFRLVGESRRQSSKPQGGLRQAEHFWEIIAHSPSDTSGYDSSRCTEWFCDKSNCIASRRNAFERVQREESSR
ncbi:hypothetical protein BPAE_0193g00090 [Botrytis paeoniae]|uniref:Uncharacterized protein n=1 Tax=Botrytis paeoniae TaxID=278948 RepID=A0A4Z1FH63_9HELO|nr:hypothetical protein BPAE_0193g00090 [Botrytis paeoniae]